MASIREADPEMTPVFSNPLVTLYQGDVLEALAQHRLERQQPAMTGMEGLR